MMELITTIRNIRKHKNISPKEKLQLFEKVNQSEINKTYDGIVVKLCNLSSFDYVTEKVEGANSFLINNSEFYVPLSQNIDIVAEKERLLKELEYNKGFLGSVLKKLTNEKFVSNAKPELLENESKKEADALDKIKVIEEQLSALK